MDSYHVLERLGEGSFGRVYKGRRKHTGQFVAMKFISKSGKTEKELEALRYEISILRQLDHENIILMLDCFETAKELVIVTEYAHGELFQILTEDKWLPEAVVQSIAKQLVSALHYLHSNRIVHRDMKPQNVLIGSNGVVKVCDFGFARKMSAATIMLTSLRGTPLYLAPECVSEQAYDYKADLWGLGVMLFELAAGYPPYYAGSLQALMKLITEDKQLRAVQWPKGMSGACRDFLAGLLQRNPAERVGWPELLHHPFVAEEGRGTGVAAGAAAAGAVGALGGAAARTEEREGAKEGSAAKGAVSSVGASYAGYNAAAEGNPAAVRAAAAASIAGAGAAVLAVHTTAALPSRPLAAAPSSYASSAGVSSAGASSSASASAAALRQGAQAASPAATGGAGAGLVSLSGDRGRIGGYARPQSAASGASGAAPAASNLSAAASASLSLQRGTSRL